MQTDEELYELSVDGDDAALKELLSRYGESLILFLRTIVGNYEDAEELELDTFAAAVSGTARFRGRSSFKTWLFAIGRKLALRSVRKRLPHIRTAASEEEKNPEAEGKNSPEPLPEFRILREEKSQVLFDAMKELKTEYCECLYLTYFEEMNREETAEAMGRTRKQISDLLNRSRQSLKTVLEKRGVRNADI